MCRPDRLDENGHWCFQWGMFLKTHVRQKDGKRHTYYSIAESVRVGKRHVYQRRVLYLGELNSTQVEAWQRTIEVITESGDCRQMRLFAATGQGEATANEEDVAEVLLSSMCVRRPREFGASWVGARMWEALKLDEFWEGVLRDERGEVPWAKVVELLTVNRLVAPRSELYIHEKWFSQTGMAVLLDCDERVAEKDRLYRCLDRIVGHKEELERHLAKRWRDLFNAQCDILLYDVTSTYFEGDVDGVPKAKRGYSRDHRGDCKQITLALVVTTEGFPLTYEIFDGNRVDVTTLEDIVNAVERKHGKARRIWVFDRGIVSEANLEFLRKRDARYLVGTRRSWLEKYEQELLSKNWNRISEEVEVKLISGKGEAEEVFVLARSTQRRKKERAMRRSAVRGLRRDLRGLRSLVHKGRLKNRDKVLQRLGGIEERYRALCQYLVVTVSETSPLKISWAFEWRKFLAAHRRDGAYLLRTNITKKDPDELWRQYIQLTEVEACFKALKSELAVRPIWHWTSKRVEAHVMVAFLGYCLWVCLKRMLFAKASGLTPWQVLQHMQKILLVEVWFKLKGGGAICLERITQPEAAESALLVQLGWQLPAQPPPRIYASMMQDVWQT